ncbi:TFIIB-type zinc ribbon-containing protein [Blastococcus deserti]|uniref:Zf-TFIIB domain-containing protein n=1 Tax=Blastococcus deserti TaxID=2259033 RepID=A0ABW4X6A8_9ACTN
MELTCPKCSGTMRTYERNGVHVDQCTECRGIFLDRGELDRLIDAENAWHGGGTAATEAPGRQQPGHQQPGYQQPSHQSAGSGAGLGAVVGEVLRQVQGSKHSGHASGHSSGSYHRRKKESFLGDLFG